jgi:DNA-binding IclR family transcriptional regulator
MAYLAEVRRLGYAMDDVEHEPDVKCVAVPIMDHTGAATCSVSVSGPQARIDRFMVERNPAERLLEVACDASTRLGYSGSLPPGRSDTASGEPLSGRR